MKSSESLYTKQEKEMIKYHHKLLLADLLHLNHVHSNFEYDGVTFDEYAIKGTRYNGLEKLEIIEEAKILFKIKYNKYFNEK